MIESQQSFNFSDRSDTTNETYIGTFKVKCFLNPLEIIKADRVYRELIGAVNPMMASTDAQNVAFAIAQLSARIIESPNWFKYDENPELNGGHLPQKILVNILNKAIDVENEFYEQQRKRMDATVKKLTKNIKSGKLKKKTEEEAEADGEADDQDEEN